MRKRDKIQKEIQELNTKHEVYLAKNRKNAFKGKFEECPIVGNPKTGTKEKLYSIIR